MTGTKFFVLISLIVALLAYAIKSERKIKELEKETQAQQITIEANNKLLERQKILLNQNKQLQKKLNDCDYGIARMYR